MSGDTSARATSGWRGGASTAPSCTGGICPADPATRLTEFVGYFDNDRSSFIFIFISISISICQPDLKQAMEKISQEVAVIFSP